MGNKINKSKKSESKLKEKKLKENDYLYNNFDINEKKLSLKVNYHNAEIYRICLLDDGRLVSSSYDKNIIIYNKRTYKPDIIIKEHKGYVYDIISLNPNMLASCSGDKTVKIFKITGNMYKILQTLKEHKRNVYRLIELKNKNLVSSSYDKSIILYSKDINNNKYKKYYKILTNEHFLSVVQTKDNEICYPVHNNIYFFDLGEKKDICSISNVDGPGVYSTFNMITKDLLIIGSKYNLFVVNVIHYKIIRKIELLNYFGISGFCMVNERTFLTTCILNILQWKIEGDDIKIISTKEKAHNLRINYIIKIGNGKIASCGYDKSIKIWQ